MGTFEHKSTGQRRVVEEGSRTASIMLAKGWRRIPDPAPTPKKKAGRPKKQK